MVKKACSFCGRTEKEVKLLITGLNGYICEDCTQQAYKIVQQQDWLREDSKGKADGKKKLKVPKPQEIKSFLDQYVIGLRTRMVWRSRRATSSWWVLPERERR